MYILIIAMIAWMLEGKQTNRRQQFKWKFLSCLPTVGLVEEMLCPICWLKSCCEILWDAAVDALVSRVLVEILWAPVVYVLVSNVLVEIMLWDLVGSCSLRPSVPCAVLIWVCVDVLCNWCFWSVWFMSSLCSVTHSSSRWHTKVALQTPFSLSDGTLST